MLITIRLKNKKINLCRCFTWFIIINILTLWYILLHGIGPNHAKSVVDLTMTLSERINGTLTANMRRLKYPKRKNMMKCLPRYGRIGIFVPVNGKTNLTRYAEAKASIECYVKTTDYQLFYIDTTTDLTVLENCKGQNFDFVRHCAAAQYSRRVDWLVALDGDTGVVNPNHCLEEWIDERVHLIFYERIYHHEIACGNYVVRNSQFAYDFLMDYSQGESYYLFDGFHGSDNGYLQLLVLRAAIPAAKYEIDACNRTYHKSTTLEEYLDHVMCVKTALGAQRVFPNALRIYRRAHFMVRDVQISAYTWSSYDFMLHGWKSHTENAYDPLDAENGVFTSMPDIKKCGPPLEGNMYPGWSWNEKLHITDEQLTQYIKSYETMLIEANYSRNEPFHVPFIKSAEYSQCYPHCEMFN